MSVIKHIGQGSLQSVTYEWKIRNFLTYSEKDTAYRSPTFCLSSSAWHILVHPNGKTEFHCKDYVSLFLHRDSDDDMPREPPVTVNFIIGIKNIKNELKNQLKATHTFEAQEDNGWHEFIERSLLLRTQSEMVPAGILTIVCCVELSNIAVPAFHIRHSKLVEDYKNLFISQENSDTILKVQDKSYMVHKAVLGARSPVLAAMFKHDTEEKKTQEVNISDCDPEDFNVFLLYIYSGIIDFAKCNNICELYRISDKYDTPELKMMCRDFMCKNISIGKFFDIKVLADQFDDDELSSDAQKFFNENYQEITSTKSWKSFSQEHVDLANDLRDKLPKISPRKRFKSKKNN